MVRVVIGTDRPPGRIIALDGVARAPLRRLGKNWLYFLLASLKVRCLSESKTVQVRALFNETSDFRLPLNVRSALPFSSLNVTAPARGAF